MSITIDNARYALIAAARESFTSDQQRQERLTGKPISPPPSDSELIAAFPPLAQQLQSLDAKSDDQAITYDKNGAAINGNPSIASTSASPTASPNANSNGASNVNGNTGSVNIGNANLTPEQLKKLNIIA